MKPIWNQKRRFHGVTVSTQDSESCDPSSNLGGTYIFLFRLNSKLHINVYMFICQKNLNSLLVNTLNVSSKYSHLNTLESL
jgi:hypothetical protein